MTRVNLPGGRFLLTSILLVAGFSTQFTAAECAGTGQVCQPTGAADECGAEGFFESADLTPADAAAGDWFGYSVSIDGNTVVVGAPNDDPAGPSSGSVYVFVRSGPNWIQQAKLTAIDAAPYDLFGGSVAIDGDTVVAGAAYHDNTGAAYVFVRNDTAWVQEAKLTAADAQSTQQFGGAVSIEGDTVLIGAYGPCPWGCPGPGSAYVFVRSGTTWVQQAKLTAADDATGALFGNSVAVDGDTAVVGASHDSEAGLPGTGSAYVFVRAGTSWTQQAKLTAADAAAGDWLGYSVAIHGDQLVAGAVLDDEGGPGSGSAYVFVRTGTSWAQQAKLTATDAVASDAFGKSVSIDEEMLVVGGDGETDHPGSVYVFVRTGTSWAQQSKLSALGSAAGDLFGFSVGTNGDTIVAGAILNDQAGDDSGSAHLFEPVADCNENNVRDSCDIAGGSSRDENGDGIPDECQVAPVLVDIKPDSCPNAFNIDARGVLPVAVLGTTGFDAERIDIASVRLSRADGVGGQVAPSEGPRGPRSRFEDVATPFDGPSCGCHEPGGDAITDLSLHFRTDDVVEGLELDDLPAGALVDLVVSGNLLGGMSFSGNDCIRLVPKH